MRIYVIFIFIMLVMVTASTAQTVNNSKNDRVLIVLNGGATMGMDWGKNNSRYDIASDIITTLITEVYKITTDVEFGLWVYGHQFKPEANRCKDGRREVFFSKDNMAQMALRLKDIRPRGKGSVENAIADAIKSDLIDTHIYRYSIIVITDSSRNCPDNICIPLNQLGKAGNIYKRFFIDMTGGKENALNHTCFDKVFPAINDYSIDTCINQILKSFKKKSEKYVRVVYESKPKKSTTDIVIPVKTKVITPVKKTETHIQVNKSDTTPVVQPKPQEETVQIRKESKIKSEIDEFGYLHLINTSVVSRVIVYRLQNENYQQTNEIYPIGMRDVKVKLKTGSYKMFFNVSGMAEGMRTFEIKEGTVSEIWFR
jgi:hypothetical protein